jgi:uncharacterized membrane protein
MMTDRQTPDIAQQLLGKAAHELAPEEHNVLAHIESGQLTSRDAGDVAETRATYGERLADKVAAIGGSWGFIIAFGFVLVGWMLLNTDILAHWNMAFDPYPYIFLNLMLSMLAAIQAPVIMMSQNRQAAKDRLAASLDFEVNLRAELEILRLHEKIDMAVAQRLDDLSARQDRIIEMLAGR